MTKQHFTVTGFIVSRERVALHWHKHVGKWLPPGGHIETNEDPVTAVHREILEETGLRIRLLGQPAYQYEHPLQLPAPKAMAIYDMVNGDGSLSEVHQHVDFIYFSTPDPDEDAEPKYEGWIWADEQMIKTGHIYAFGRDEPIASDVRELSLSAIATYRKLKGINQ